MNEKQTELNMFGKPTQHRAPGQPWLPVKVFVDHDVKPVLLDEDTALFHRITAYLVKHCQGKENSQTAAQIAVAFGMEGEHDGRKIRHALNLNLDRVPTTLVGMGKGFYCTDDPEVLAHKDRELTARIASIAVLRKKHRTMARTHGFIIEGQGANVTYRKKEINNDQR